MQTPRTKNEWLVIISLTDKSSIGFFKAGLGFHLGCSDPSVLFLEKHGSFTMIKIMQE